MLDTYYFDNETIRNEDYCLLLDIYVRTETKNFPNNFLFQQDGAPPHTSRNPCTLLSEIFDQIRIGKHVPINWPARSPDLTYPNFFLWGYAKDHVFKSPVQNVTQLKR